MTALSTYLLVIIFTLLAAFVGMALEWRRDLKHFQQRIAGLQRAEDSELRWLHKHALRFIQPSRLGEFWAAYEARLDDRGNDADDRGAS